MRAPHRSRCCLPLLAGCGGTTVRREPVVAVAGAPSARPVREGPRDSVRIAVVTHGPASSPFWAIVRNGVDAASRRLDVLVNYPRPTSLLARMER